ncbi:hypothetical protein R0J93_20830, partial [Pseudoalteromonas sp. SIMBA_148]
NEGEPTALAFVATDPNATNVDPEGFDVWEYRTLTTRLEAGDNTITLAIPQGRNNGRDAYVGAYYQDARRPRPAPLKDVSRRLVLEYFQVSDSGDLAKSTSEFLRKNRAGADVGASEPGWTR